MKRILKAFSALCLAALVGCGGGGGDAGTNPNSPANPVKPVASIDYQLDKSTITTRGRMRLPLLSLPLMPLTILCLEQRLQ